MITKILEPLAVKICGGLVIVLAILLGASQMQSAARLHGWNMEKAAHQGTKDGYTTAMAIARADALADKMKAEETARQKQKASDDAYAKNLAHNRALADRYRAAHGVPGPTGAGVAGDAGEANLPGFSAGAPGDYGPDSGRGMVAISGASFDACTIGLTRLHEAQDWAASALPIAPPPPATGGTDRPPGSP